MSQLAPKPLRITWLLCYVIAALPILSSPAFAAPEISEILANNGTTLDEDADTSDWIEIHNPDSFSIDLGRHALSDDPLIPQKWIFPNGTTLAPDGYLLVFASTKDRAITGQELHTNFSLASSGDYLSLADATGTILQEFSPTFPNQKRDIAYGKSNTGTVAYLDPPTPNAPNGPPLSGFVEDTIFSHKRGFYETPFSVTISTATPGASIRYTTNGNKPTPTSGTLYSTPIPISATTNLRALAFMNGMVQTNVDAQSYLFAADIISQPEMSTAITESPTYNGEITAAITSLPVVSLSFRDADFFGGSGIHSNPNLSGRTSEREVHFEFFDPADPDNSTHEPGGVRIHGGNSRQHPKKAFRLYFRDDYGKKRLEHEIFAGSPVTSFKQLLLRGGGHDAWTFRSSWDQATLIRNEFLHRLQLAMGQPSPVGRYVSLFLNGDYWGVYELQELPHEYYNADHHGGQPEDWDVIKHGEEVESGDLTAWNAMINLARGGISSNSDYQAIQEYVDVDHFADAMIQRIWSSDEDWLGPFFRNGNNETAFSSDKNWYVARKSRNGTSKFFFYTWDAEMSMGIPFTGGRNFINDFSKVANDDSPGIIYDALRRHPEFQLAFADRLYKHMFNGGVMTTSELQTLWDSLADKVQTPIVGESARWGLDYWGGSRSSPMTRDGDWIPANNWVRTQFLTNRSSTVLDDFRAVGLYPDTAAPQLSPFGANSLTPVGLTMSSTTGGSTIYYTTDGSDPRVPGESSTLNLVPSDAPVQAIVPSAAMDSQIGTTWRDTADPSNIAAWQTGPNGVGYEQSPFSATSFAEIIETELTNMRNVNPSAYVRIKFDIADQATLDSINTLTLRVRYDDGFIAYLNGGQIESANSFSSSWNATSSASHSDSLALDFESFNVTDEIGQLQIGANVLAIHGLNRAVDSSDFLIQATLEADTGEPDGSVAPNALPYSSSITLDHSQRIKARTRAADGSWSALADASYLIGTPASAANLTVSEIHYHPSDPTTVAELAISGSDDDFEFIELLNTTGDIIDLSNCTFTNGIDFDFPVGTALPPGGYGLLISNRDAFLARYGATVESAILGEFANNTNLSNRGERIALTAADGSIIFDFVYDDAPPWPTEADGPGASLVLIAPTMTPNAELGDATKWRASLLDHGAPASPDQMSFRLWSLKTYGPLDSNDPAISGELTVPPGGGGLPNLILYAQGHDLSNGNPLQLSEIGLTEGDEIYLTLTYQIRSDPTEVSVAPQVGDNLSDWSHTTILMSKTQNLDGTTTIVVRDPIALTPNSKRFFRLQITRP